MKTEHSPGPWHLKGQVVCANIPNGTVTIETPVADVCSTGAEIWRREEQANAKLIAAAPDLLEALIAISSNEHLDLGDRIYDVREREGEGWEGPSVKAWSDAVQKVKSAIKTAIE